MVHPSLAPDIGGSSSLLLGAMRAIVVSIDSNVQQLLAHAPYCVSILVELWDLEQRAISRDEEVRDHLSTAREFETMARGPLLHAQDDLQMNHS